MDEEQKKVTVGVADYAAFNRAWAQERYATFGYTFSGQAREVVRP